MPRLLSRTGDDREIVERARRGDRGAFEELVVRHADRLYAVVLHFVGNAEEAEDVTQEAFLRAWRAIGRFEGRSQFFTWLYRIGINEAKRRADRRGAPTVSLEESAVPEPPDLSQAPQTRAEQRDLRMALEQAVRRLPWKYRAALILRDVEGLSTEQAAAAMGLREGAFKSRLHRARVAVKEAVRDHLDEETS